VWADHLVRCTTTLNAETNGTGTPDPANPGFVNLHLEVKFTGGTGKFANARSKGEIDGVAMVTSATGGIATWTLKGLALTPAFKD
jgi:hypothetical protein